MQLGTDITHDGGMRLTVTYGPVLTSIILDPDDEEMVLKLLQTGFAEARAVREHGDNHNGDDHVHDG